jgi:thioredoxin reductase (NADPH)
MAVAEPNPKETARMENVIIIGTGAAGLTAAIYSARASLNPLVIEGREPGGQLTTTTEVENFPGFEHGILGPVLMETIRKQASRFGTRYQYGSVTGCELAGPVKKLHLDSGETLEAKSVIICTGASAKYLGLPSEQALIGYGVTSCATCDGAFYRDVPVAVIGGGDSAMEEATFLTRFASVVYLIHRREEFRASKVMIDRMLANPKIKPLYNTVVEEVLGVENQRVRGMRIKNLKSGEVSDIALEGVFLAIGHKPNTDPFKGQLDMDETGYLITDSTKTKLPGVFAAGDVQDSVYRQAISAAGTGCMAALEAERYLERTAHA